jgi:predicted GIY-YIG superfamily endonuclease
VSDLNERPHVLYRFFDAEDELLYVGITVGLRGRLAKHEVEKHWYGEIARISVEHFPSRDAVLAAEKAAIQAEKPQHNVQHNGVRPASSSTIGATAGGTKWTFRSLRSDYERSTPLWLNWEVHCDPMSDEYYIDEIEPEDLWYEWVRRYPRDPDAEQIFGPGAVSIGWYVEGPGTIESAPLQDLRPLNLGLRRHGLGPDQRDFLSYFTEPYNTATGEPMRWAALPVIDKVWRERDLPSGPHTSKGGFIQEATGWKPSPLQPFVNIEQLARASGLARPSLFRERLKGAA